MARIAGLPRETIDRAARLLESLAVHTETHPHAPASPATPGQMSLFTEYIEHPAVDALRELDLEGMTPLEAFDALRRLRDQVRD